MEIGSFCTKWIYLEVGIIIKYLQSLFFCIRFYGQDIRASAILLGDVPFPAQADDLYEILASFTEVYENEEQKNNPGKSVREQRRVCALLFHIGFPCSWADCSWSVLMLLLMCHF